MYRPILLIVCASAGFGFRPPDIPVRPHLETLRNLPLPLLEGELGSHELHTIHEEVFIAPATGVVTGTVSVTLTAGPNGFRSLVAVLDGGLLFDRVWTEAANVPFHGDVVDGFSYAQVDMFPTVAAGTTLTLHFRYAGTLLCPVYNYFSNCDFGGQRLDFAMVGSAFASIYDPSDYESTPYYQRTLTLQVPDNTSTLVSADLVSETVAGGITTTEWIVPVRHDISAYLAIFGDLIERDVPNVSVPTKVVHLAGDTQWVDEIVGWTTDIISYLDAQAGRPFPYPRLNIVKLPDTARFPGTAGHATSLLANYYGDSSARYFEETFAHETSHVWWAVLTTDYYMNTRFLSEGLATFTQIDYTGTKSTMEEDRYLGWRYNEIRNVFLYNHPFADLPPVVPEPDVQITTTAYTEWAYLKGAAVLDLLRVTIGKEAFNNALHSYVQNCINVPCTAADLQEAVEIEVGDVSWFFDQYVYNSASPRIEIDFLPLADSDQTQITVKRFDSFINNLELWLELADGSRETVRVRVDEDQKVLLVTTAAEVLRVRPNPRYEAVLFLASPNERDVDFDGELDGADLIRCARLVGMHAFDPGHLITDGITTGRLDFDARCDVNRDSRIDRVDLDLLVNRFPEVRR